MRQLPLLLACLFAFDPSLWPQWDIICQETYVTAQPVPTWFYDLRFQEGALCTLRLTTESAQADAVNEACNNYRLFRDVPPSPSLLAGEPGVQAPPASEQEPKQ